MRDKVKNILKENNSTQHYLKKAITDYQYYFDGFEEATGNLKNMISEKLFEDLTENKLQVRDIQFNEKGFVQCACEITVSSYFAENYPDGFEYEAVLSALSSKDVDCRFKVDGFKYNIEVKCSDFTTKENIEKKDGFKIVHSGRNPDFKETEKEISQMLSEGQRLKGVDPKPTFVQKNMDNNLKDFLISSNNKFSPISSESEVNILLVCCGDQHDMQSWHGYLYGHQGLFTEQSFCNKDEYKNVDLVILTNLYHRHFEYFNKSHIKKNWSLCNAFNLCFSNQFRKKDKKEAILKFLEVFPHFTYELDKYRVPGDVDQNIIDSIRIPYFVEEKLKAKGKIYF